MPRRIIRTATIAIATAALAAPAALARPDAPPAVAKTTPAAKHNQDARSPDAIDAAANPRDVSSPDAPHQGPWSSLADGPPSAPPSSRPHLTPNATTDPGIAWATIALGIAGSLVAVGAIAGIASRTRRTARARITA
jgi:hypothetical protein